MPARVLLCFALAPGAPALTAGGTTPRLSPFGRWLHRRISAASRRWPAVTFQRLRFTGPEVRLVLLVGHSAPPLAVGLVVARALQRETNLAARSAGWLGESDSLWCAGGTSIWCFVATRVVAVGTDRNVRAGRVVVPAPGEEPERFTGTAARGRYKYSPAS